MALYFAAHGTGKVRSGPDAQPKLYTSPARVLLNGLGSDELLGGYGRHRTTFHAGSWRAVIDEVRHQNIYLFRFGTYFSRYIFAAISFNSRWIAFLRAISAVMIA
jgi:asparagine synthetase B (glutamine-hydrolysing)